MAFADFLVVLDLPGLLSQVAADGHVSGSGKFRVVLDLPSWFLIYLGFLETGVLSTFQKMSWFLIYHVVVLDLPVLDLPHVFVLIYLRVVLDLPMPVSWNL